MSRAKLPFSKCWLFVSIATFQRAGKSFTHIRCQKKQEKSSEKSKIEKFPGFFFSADLCAKFQRIKLLSHVIHEKEQKMMTSIQRFRIRLPGTVPNLGRTAAYSGLWINDILKGLEFPLPFYRKFPQNPLIQISQIKC